MAKVTIHSSEFNGWLVNATVENENGTYSGPVAIQLGKTATKADLEKALEELYAPTSEEG